MKLTVQLQLLPDADAAKILRLTMERFNAAADWVASELFVRQVRNKIVAQKLLYHEVRERFGLSAQTAILCIHRAVEAYKRDVSIRPCFRKHGAITYDQRVMHFQGIDRVSLWTLEGRVIVPFILGAYQREHFTLRKGQADLVLRKDGKWFLLVIVDVPDGAPTPTTDFIGVDLGIVKLAVDSDGNAYSGEAVEKVRRRNNTNRKRLQRRGTNGARKKLKLLSSREGRQRRHVNHCISKAIVATAKRTGRGIALEELTHIRGRVSARGAEARNRLSGWAFFQLRAFVEYKARLAGVPVRFVDPRNTSRTCSECGYCDKGNRKSQATFVCLHCGYSANADENAARNIRALGCCNPASELADATHTLASA